MASVYNRHKGNGEMTSSDNPILRKTCTGFHGFVLSRRAETGDNVREENLAVRLACFERMLVTSNRDVEVCMTTDNLLKRPHVANFDRFSAMSQRIRKPMLYIAKRKTS